MSSEKDFICSTSSGSDSSGAIKNTIGYTSTKSPLRDKSGHYFMNEAAEEIEPNDKKCYAKKIIIENTNGETRSKYYVKVGPDGYIFNPWGMFTEGTESEYQRHRGKNRWNFREVSERCFLFYNKFLQSKNKAWLTNAEREIR